MSIGTLASSAPSPIIPVTDELIEVPVNAPKEQERKIMAFNELLEEVYFRKIELESLEGSLVAMKAEIEGDIEHLALKGAEQVPLKAQWRKSGTTAVTAFRHSGSPPRAEDEVGPKNSLNVTANAVIADLKSAAGAIKSVKSRGKGKGRQEKAKLDGKDLKYHKGHQINHVYGDEEESERYDSEEDGFYRGGSKTPPTGA